MIIKNGTITFGRLSEMLPENEDIKINMVFVNISTILSRMEI